MMIRKYWEIMKAAKDQVLQTLKSVSSNFSDKREETKVVYLHV